MVYADVKSYNLNYNFLCTSGQTSLPNDMHRSQILTLNSWSKLECLKAFQLLKGINLKLATELYMIYGGNMRNVMNHSVDEHKTVYAALARVSKEDMPILLSQGGATNKKSIDNLRSIYCKYEIIKGLHGLGDREEFNMLQSTDMLCCPVSEYIREYLCDRFGDIYDILLNSSKLIGGAVYGMIYEETVHRDFKNSKNITLHTRNYVLSSNYIPYNDLLVSLSKLNSVDDQLNYLKQVVNNPSQFPVLSSISVQLKELHSRLLVSPILFSIYDISTILTRSNKNSKLNFIESVDEDTAPVSHNDLNFPTKIKLDELKYSNIKGNWNDFYKECANIAPYAYIRPTLTNQPVFDSCFNSGGVKYLTQITVSQVHSFGSESSINKYLKSEDESFTYFVLLPTPDDALEFDFIDYLDLKKMNCVIGYYTK